MPRRRIWPFALAGGGVAAAAIATALSLGSHTIHTPTPAPPALPIPNPHGRTIVVVDPKAPEAWRGAEAGEQVRAQLHVAGKVSPLDGATSAIVARELADPDHSSNAYGRIVAQTGAQVVVTGELRGDKVHLRAIDPSSGRVIGEYDDVAALRTMLAGGPTAPDADSTAHVLPVSSDAARAYAEGLVASRAHDHATAIAKLTQATTLESDFAPAFLALTDELSLVRQHDNAAKAAERGLQLSASLPSDQRVRAEATYREQTKDFAKAETLWRSLLDVDPDEVGVAQALARTYMQDNAVDKCFEVIESLRSKPAPVGDDPRLDLQEAMCARQAGDFKRGLSAATRADLKVTQRGPLELEALAATLEGQMLGAGGELDRALVALRRAKDLTDKLHDTELAIEPLRQLGTVLEEQGKLDEAIAMYQQAIADAKQVGDHLAEGIVLTDWGRSIERPEKALAMFQDAVAIAKQEHDDRLVIAASLNVALALGRLRRHDEALATFSDVIDLATKLHDDSNLAIAAMDKADSLIDLDRETEALPLIARAMESFERRGDQDGIGFAHVTAGDAHMSIGAMDDARKDYEAALALRRKLGEAHGIAAALQHLARFEYEQGHPETAEPRMVEAIAQYRKEPDRPEQLADGLRLYSTIEIALGKKAEALAAVDEMEKVAKPDPKTPEASEVAMVHAIVDPTRAEASLAVIHGVERVPGCLGCDLFAHTDEAELEASLGHKARARALLLDVQRRAKANHAESVAVRAAIMLAKL